MRYYIQRFSLFFFVLVISVFLGISSLVLAADPPTISGVSPSSGFQGETLNSVFVNGTFTTSGSSTTIIIVSFSGTGVTWEPLGQSADFMRGKVVVASDASTGMRSVTVNISGAGDGGDGISIKPNAFEVLSITGSGGSTSGLPEAKYRLLSDSEAPGSGEDLIGLIVRFANWVFAFFLALSIIYIVMAAFQFVTGGPEGVSDARQKLIYAAIGIAIGLIALGIPAIIRNIVTAT